ncbi:MAG: YgeY family selenium metabolism-linked hydrolase [Calditrichaceae bacterium]|nr:YgeY family selenium metabolism-linked hydrolase [Calditrichaceae bacterium]MBN2708894.1 YgeY family selenium metabolism-linked hydrolase [Calditrichaceae bacterium]RQV97581.1 MAG: YgeY family selenium metabolism-linked hydrolase [Calditrichota bacterium]
MDKTIRDQIIALSEKYTGACAHFLRELIAIPSLSSQEEKVVKRIEREMQTNDFDEITIDPMGNILGRIGSGPRIIAFDAHVDTVDVGNPDLWNIDPFTGKEENGIIYGRGASDMKGGMAAIAYAGKIMKEIGIPDDFTVYMTGSVQEEDCDGLCWQYIYKEDGLRSELVVITEPTNLNIYRGHRGRMEIEVETSGISCHGSAPERGENAIYKMAPIITDIQKLNDRLKTDEFLGKGTVTISQIRSTSPSLCAVADRSVIHLDRRLTAGETEESALDEIRELPSFKEQGATLRVLEYHTPSYKGLVYPTKKYYPGWKTKPDQAGLIAGQKAFRELFGKEPVVDKWVFSTNGVATAGMFGIPTIGFGPANEIYAHSPQDQCPVDHLTKAMQFYCGLIFNLP